MKIIKAFIAILLILSILAPTAVFAATYTPEEFLANRLSGLHAVYTGDELATKAALIDAARYIANNAMGNQSDNSVQIRSVKWGGKTYKDVCVIVYHTTGKQSKTHNEQALSLYYAIVEGVAHPYIIGQKGDYKSIAAGFAARSSGGKYANIYIAILLFK